MLLGVRRIITTVAVMGFFISAHAQSLPNRAAVTCTDAQEQRAGDESVTLRTWNALYSSYQAYRQCDDGFIAEGFSKSVARILVDHWETLSRLDKLGSKDVSFQRFAVRHVDATLDLGDLKRIVQNTNKQCPESLKGICAELATRADAAIAGSHCPDPTRRQATIGGQTIAAYVSPKNGKPFSFETVRVYSSTGQLAYVGATDKEGSFSTDSLPEGDYRLTVSGWGSTSVRLSHELDKKYGSLGTSFSLDLMDNECVGVGYGGN